MERVAFLLERSGERISCLLNPENLEARRTAGLRTRQGGGGFLTGVARSEDPLIATGGGVTEYDLHLLFDVEVAREGRVERRPVQPSPQRPIGEDRGHARTSSRMASGGRTMVTPSGTFRGSSTPLKAARSGHRLGSP